MADEDLSSASEGGAAPAGEQQEIEGAGKPDSQSQSTESGQPVDTGESQASSRKPQARQNYNWANQRLIEKAIEKKLSSALDEKLSPFLERLSQPQGTPAQPNAQVDYNDLEGSITKLIEARIEKEMEGRLDKSIPSLKKELLNDLTTKASRQEARKYLLSQKDIGSDPSRHEEIENIIMNDEILYEAVGSHPLKVMQRAVDQWRKGRTNPNAPPKEELTTVTGGMGAAQRGGQLSPQKVRELQDKVLRADLPLEERDKLNREIDAYAKSF